MLKRRMKSIVLLLVCVLLTGCNNVGGAKDSSQNDEKKEEDKIVVGFSQLGAESDWRSENTESMKNALSSQNGFQLIFEDGQQKQSNQITAIRTFIQQGVDYIVLAPVTETGWDTVLQEAKDAGIPVIVVDRMIDVNDKSLFTCWVGANFELEGKKAAEWLNQYVNINEMSPEDIHIVNIQGTLGATSQIGRTKALAQAAKKFGWDLMAEVPGDFTQAKAREVMEDLLKKHDNINVVYCENDNEAFGAIEAIEAAGKAVGSDIKNGQIMVISFDGVNDDALKYVKEDKITCITECNPHHGPRVQNIIETLEAGEVPEKFNYVDGEIFSVYGLVKKVTVGESTYTITWQIDIEE